MKSTTKLHRISGAAIGLAVFACLAVVINLFIFIRLYPVIVAFDPLPDWAEPSGVVVGACFLVIGLAHLVMLGTLAGQIHQLQRVSPPLALLAGLGVVSILLLLADVPALSDIGNQYEAGLGTGAEWFILFLNHGLHLIFLATSAWCATITRRALIRLEPMEPAERDEAIFLSIHYVGTLSALLGLGVILYLVVIHFPGRWLAAAVTVFGIIALAPYALALGIWFLSKIRRPIREWLDEKQFLDLARAGLTTLLVTVPLLLIAYLVQRTFLPDTAIRDLWFPGIAFLNLLVFSSGTIWFARRPG